MQVVTFSSEITVHFRKSAGSMRVEFQPGRAYILSNSQYVQLANGPLSATIWRQSEVEARTRPFFASRYGGNGESVLFYAGAGGYGDQLMAIPAAKYLAELGYAVTALVEPGNEQCWAHHVWLRGLMMVPCLMETFVDFQHQALYEKVTNFDEHRDQRHPTDNILHRIGIETDTVPAYKKRVAPIITETERRAANDFIANRAIGLYQLGGSGASRRLPARASRNLLMELARRIPELHWIGLYDTHVAGAYCEPLPDDAPKNAELISFRGIRLLFAVASQARIGVGVDSLLVHLMGSFNRPMVALWGPTSPNLRTRYYLNHTPLGRGSAVCPHSPCLRIKPDFEKCPAEAAAAQTCLCIKELSVDDVVEAVRVALHTKMECS